MALPISIPYTFANATTSIPLSQLDTDISTIYATVNGIGNGTVALSNVVITGGIISNVSGISTSAISNGTSNVSIATANGNVVVATAGTTAMTIDTSQNVGIGTSSPSSKLSVGGNPPSSGAIAGVASSGGTSLALSDNVNNSLYVRHPSSAATLCTDSGGALAFATNGNTERMRIDSSGNLLVGTTSVLGGTNKFCLLYDGSTAGGLLTQTSTNVTYTAAVFKNSSGTTVGSISASSSATSYVTSSDYRMKENVAAITTGLVVVAALRPVTYDWVSDKSQGEGFIAHELQSVIPLAVTGEKDAVDDEGNIKPQGVDYSKIVVHIVAAIQELSAKNDALEARLAALEAK